MALGGGTFTTMNKILPGTYINFVSAPRASAALSDRGIAAMPAEFDWGPEGAVFAVESGEFEKRSLELFGYPYTHEKLKGLRDLFRNIRKGYFYRLNTGGEPAKNDFATALHPGTRGNSLRIVIEAAEASTEETPVYDVSTWMDDTRIDLQTVKTAAQLHDNAFVRFQAEATLAATAGANLTGGTDGAAGDAAYQTFLDQIEPYTFHALGCLSDKPAVKALFTAFTKRKPYRTIQKAVDAIKPYHTDASIIIGAGDYDESVEIRNKTASIGLSRETRENKVKLKYIGAAYCRQIWLDGLSFDGTGLEGDRPCINVMCVNNMQIHYCEIAGGPAIGGIGLDSASAYVANTSISNCGRAITVIYNSLLTARGVGGAGNQIGYSAHSSILNITGSSLQATTLTEKRNGGIIYKDGVLV